MTKSTYIKPHSNAAYALLVSCGAPQTGRDYQNLLAVKHDADVDTSEMNRVLRRLTDLAFLTATVIDGDPIGRKAYTVTPAGEEAATRVYNLMHPAAA